MPDHRPGFGRTHRHRFPRRLGAIFILALAAACSPRAADCTRTAEAESAFPAPGARVLARSIGASCDKAVGLIVLLGDDGTPAWAWTAPLHPTFGNLFEARAGQTPSTETADGFLARWAQVRVTTTADAPPWPQGAEAVAGGGHTTLDRRTYEDLRARALPMACHLSGVARETCVFWEPAAAAAAPLIERDIAAE